MSIRGYKVRQLGFVGEVGVPKAVQVLAALKRDGWTQIRRHGSHRQLEKDGVTRTWAHHDGSDLGAARMAQVARTFGYTLDELRRL